MYNSTKIPQILMVLVLCCFLLPTISAEIQTLGVFKQNSCVNLLQNCNCSYVNITSVMFPNSTFALNGQYGMTKSGNHFNYSFCNTSAIGQYIVNGFGDEGGSGITVFTYDFDITPTGDNRGIALFLVMLFTALFLFAIDYFVDTDYLTFLSGVLLILSGVYAMIYGVIGLADLYTRGIAIVLIGVGIVVLIGSAYSFLKGDDD